MIVSDCWSLTIFIIFGLWDSICASVSLGSLCIGQGRQRRCRKRRQHLCHCMPRPSYKRFRSFDIEWVLGPWIGTHITQRCRWRRCMNVCRVRTSATGIRNCQFDHVDMMSSELSGMFPNVLDIASTPKSAINSTSFSLATVILLLQPYNIYHGRRLLQTFGH